MNGLPGCGPTDGAMRDILTDIPSPSCFCLGVSLTFDREPRGTCPFPAPFHEGILGWASYLAPCSTKVHPLRSPPSFCVNENFDQCPIAFPLLFIFFLSCFEFSLLPTPSNLISPPQPSAVQNTLCREQCRVPDTSLFLWLTSDPSDRANYFPPCAERTGVHPI